MATSCLSIDKHLDGLVRDSYKGSRIDHLSRYCIMGFQADEKHLCYVEQRTNMCRMLIVEVHPGGSHRMISRQFIDIVRHMPLSFP